MHEQNAKQVIMQLIRPDQLRGTSYWALLLDIKIVEEANSFTTNLTLGMALDRRRPKQVTQ
jgi:hypothetical protein